ncbi:MAG: cytosolic protein, partial [Candidatus Poribacteria bacterium]
IINLLRFLDWVMQLPKELEDEFWQEIQHYEDGRYMPYLTEFEKKAIRRGLTQGFKEGKKLGIKEGIIKGRRQGILKGIELGIKLKFGKEGLSLLPEIQKILDLNILEKIHSSIETVDNLEDLRNIYQ